MLDKRRGHGSRVGALYSLCTYSQICDCGLRSSACGLLTGPDMLRKDVASFRTCTNCAPDTKRTVTGQRFCRWKCSGPDNTYRTSRRSDCQAFTASKYALPRCGEHWADSMPSLGRPACMTSQQGLSWPVPSAKSRQSHMTSATHSFARSLCLLARCPGICNPPAWPHAKWVRQSGSSQLPSGTPSAAPRRSNSLILIEWC